MVCHYGMILYETVESLGNKHEFQRFKIVEVSKIIRTFHVIEMMKKKTFSTRSRSNCTVSRHRI